MAWKNAQLSAIIFVTLLITGCATPYQEMGYSGGFESNWLAPDVLTVDVKGNGFTDDRRVKDYALLQAAERAQEAGYRYFTIISNKNNGHQDQFYIPPTSTTTTTGVVTENSFTAKSTTTTTGGVEQIYKPARSIVVRMFRNVPPGYLPGQYCDVTKILGTLGQKYKN